MFKIITSDLLSAAVKRLEVEAPLIAQKAQPGQFIVLRVAERGERIPLTIAGQDAVRGTITLVFQSIGKTTASLFALQPGDHILDILGPLGHPTEIRKAGTVVAVGGGVGVAEVLPVAKAFKAAGNRVIGVIGARTKELVLFKEEMKQACDEIFIATDDGSYGRKGFVTDVIKDIAAETTIDLLYAIGPVPMMKNVSAMTAPLTIPTLVSLNPIMVDGTGMCGACRVTIGGNIHFACVDGPEFDGHQVNWNEIMQRLALFKEEEKKSLERFRTECKCPKE